MGKVIFKLPDLGEGVVEAEIIEWHIKVGDLVEEDQTLVDVMTDKATVEIPAPLNGKILTINGEPGDIVTVGSEFIVFEATGDASIEEAPAPVAAPVAPAAPDNVVQMTPAKPAAPAAPVAPAAASVAAAVSSGGLLLTSPSIRRRAAESGVDLAAVAGTGPSGRIMLEDFEGFLAGGNRAAAVQGKVQLTGTTEIKLIGLRRKIAEKMAISARTIPHFTYVEELDITEVEALRQHLNKTRSADQPKLTLLPFLMQALVKVIKDFPTVNSTFDEESGIITQYEGVHIGIAAQTDDGLKVPVVKHSEALDIWQCAAEVARVSEAAKNNTAKMNELTGSSITITSLGALGGVVSTPVINHPEVGIIGVNKMQERLVMVDGQVTTRLMMNLSSSFDHRIVDGYVAAQMIQAMKALIEHPATIFI